MKVTVCITTRNRLKLLIRAIESVLNQDYRDIELIIIDDNSTENIRETIDSYFKGISYTYIFNQQRRGLSFCRNQGIYAAKGEWIIFLDDDDELFPNSVSKRLSIIKAQENLRDIVLIYSAALVYNEDFQKEFINYPKIDGDIRQSLTKGKISTIPSAGLYNCEIMKELKGYDENLMSFVDHDMWVNFAYNSLRCISINDPLVKNYEYAKKKSMVSNTERRISSIDHFLLKWQLFLQEIMGIRGFESFIVSYRFRVIGGLLMNSLLQFNFLEVKLCWGYLTKNNGFLVTLLYCAMQYPLTVFKAFYHRLF